MELIDDDYETDFEDFVTLDNGGKVHYRMKGDGPYTVVMTHGAPGSYQDFRHLIPKLDSSMRVIAFDLPGFGKSCTKATDSPAEADLARGVWRALDKLGVDENIVALGHSFGGQTAMHLANQRPERIQALAFLSSTGLRRQRIFFPRPILRMIAAAITHPWTKDRAMDLLHPFYINWVRFPKSTTRAVIRNATLRFENLSFDDIRYELVPSVAHFPTFCAYAKNDHIIQEDIFEEFAEQFAEGPRIIFEKGGHNIQKSCADDIADALNEWVPEVFETK